MATIGEMTNVPEPGAAVASPWAQDVSTKAVHTFPTKAALNAWGTPPVGTYADVANQDGFPVLYRRVTGGWSQVTPWNSAVAGIAYGGGAAWPAGAVIISTLTVPADPGIRYADVSCHIQWDRIVGAGALTVYINVDGARHGRHYFGFVGNEAVRPPQQYSSFGVRGSPLPVNAPCVIKVEAESAGAGGINQCYADYMVNRLDVVVYPRNRTL